MTGCFQTLGSANRGLTVDSDNDRPRGKMQMRTQFQSPIGPVPNLFGSFEFRVFGVVFLDGFRAARAVFAALRATGTS